MGAVFTVIPWGQDKYYGNTVGMQGTIMQQTAVLNFEIIL